MDQTIGRLRPIWIDRQTDVVSVIDQRYLPHQEVNMALTSVDQVIFAIRQMVVRALRSSA